MNGIDRVRFDYVVLPPKIAKELGSLDVARIVRRLAIRPIRRAALGVLEGGYMSREIEDGMGFSGLVPSRAETEEAKRLDASRHARRVLERQVEARDARIAELEAAISWGKEIMYKATRGSYRGPPRNSDWDSEAYWSKWADEWIREPIAATRPRLDTLCPHGFVLADNTCGPCSEGRPNRSQHTSGEQQ